MHPSFPCFKTSFKPRLKLATHPLDSYLEVGLPSKTLILDNLDPVPVRIQQERNVFHPAVRQPLLPGALQVLESLACRVEVIH